MIAATAVATQLSTIIQYNTTQCTMVARRGRVAMQSRWTLNRWILSPFRKIVSDSGTCLPLCPSFWTLALAVFPPPDPCPPPPDPPLLYLALVCSQGWRQLGQGGWWNASVPIQYLIHGDKPGPSGSSGFPNYPLSWPWILAILRQRKSIMAVNNKSSIKTNFSKSFSLPAGESPSPAGLFPPELS